jgi:hypothetical protein
MPAKRKAQKRQKYCRISTYFQFNGSELDLLERRVKTLFLEDQEIDERAEPNIRPAAEAHVHKMIWAVATGQSGPEMPLSSLLRVFEAAQIGYENARRFRSDKEARHSALVWAQLVLEECLGIGAVTAYVDNAYLDRLSLRLLKQPKSRT